MHAAPGLVWHHYKLFGLTLRSTIELPELEAGESGGSGEVVELRYGAVPSPPDGMRALANTPEGTIMAIADVGRFRIAQGRRIEVDPLPDASPRNVRLYLLGSAMGVLLHQRGLLPLHANAVEVDRRAVAFLGHSGAGKSTLAAAFHDRGGRILSDDVCVVTRDGDGFTVHAGIPRLRLWRDAVERSGRKIDGYEPAFDLMDKYTVGTDPAARAEAMPLRALYLLRRDEPDADLSLRRLPRAEAIKAMIENTYRGAAIRTVGNSSAYFETCVALSGAIPVFELIRPWNAARIDETVTRVEAHLRAEVA